MKGRILTVIVVAIAFLAASVALAGISTTKHNLASSGGQTIRSTNVDEICVFCHTPHFANTNAQPLWNRVNPGNGNNFTMYGNTIAGTSTETQPGTMTKACLSCHDGVTALNSLTNYPGAGLSGTINMTQNYINGEATNIGMSLANDHPVSITYNTGKANLRAPNGNASYTVVKVIDATTVGGVSGSSKVECSSCHDPHVSSPTLFLRLNNSGSALCLACHQK